MTHHLAIRADELLLEVAQPRAVPLDVIRNISLQILHARDARLEERMEDDFLGIRTSASAMRREK